MKERRRIWIPEAPMVNLRRYHEIGEIKHRAAIEGYFTVELIHARTGLVKRQLHFRNVITNDALNALLTGTVANDLTTALAVGTGSTPPDVGDSSLVAEVARTTNNGGFSDATGAEGSGANTVYRWNRRTRIFTESQANGNLAELGMFSATGVMFCRQLFRDELGNPTTITKTTDDQLRVRYEWRVYPPMDDDIQELTVAGDPRTVTIRSSLVTAGVWSPTSFGGDTSLVNAYSGGLSDRASSPSGTSAAGSVTMHPYDSGSYERSFEAVWGPSSANYAGGVRSFGSSSSGAAQLPRFQVEVFPAIQKTDAERLIAQFSTAIARYEP